MASQKVFVVFFAIFCASVLGKPFTIDVLETKDLIFPREGELVKRTADEQVNNDVSELSIQKISLSSFIDNIESGLLQTALSAGSVAHNPNAQLQIVPTPHSIIKRSTSEDDRSLNGDNSPIVLLQTTENVLGDDAIPAHVVIDRVSIYKAPVSGSVLLPTFHLQETIVSGETGEVIAEVEEDQYVLDTSGKTSNSSSSSEESSESSEESSEETSSTSTTTTTTSAPISTSPVPSALPLVGNEASSVPPVSSTSPPSTTLLIPVGEKKPVENKSEEKVADYVAEPVILTARL